MTLHRLRICSGMNGLVSLVELDDKPLNCTKIVITAEARHLTTAVITLPVDLIEADLDEITVNLRVERSSKPTGQQSPTGP